uniref:Uncharacterized protein n=1 Tax=Setaria viridis TaxID=4556 RepID=A0A4U6SY47_SETVI|nr:hypothetical protein SEVIR_9G200250v2 [Setaria viridis]
MSVYPVWKNKIGAASEASQPRLTRPEPDPFLTPPAGEMARPPPGPPPLSLFVAPAERGGASATPNSAASGRHRRGRGPLVASARPIRARTPRGPSLPAPSSLRRTLHPTRRERGAPWSVVARDGARSAAPLSGV